MPKSPPPLPGKEQRQHERIELYAQVQVRWGGEVHILSISNASLGGLFLEGKSADHPELVSGKLIELLLADAGAPAADPIELSGKIVRIEPSGFGVMITSIREASYSRYQAILRAAPR